MECLLKGTRVKTESGYTPIESIQQGDYIVNQESKLVQVTETGKWEFRFDEPTNSPWVQVYKLPKGIFSTDSPVYISKGHRIVLKNGGTILPTNIGIQPATKEEICDEDGMYTLCHIRVEQSKQNHLVVNGNCIVESWC